MGTANFSRVRSIFVGSGAGEPVAYLYRIVRNLAALVATALQAGIVRVMGVAFSAAAGDAGALVAT